MLNLESGTLVVQEMNGVRLFLKTSTIRIVMVGKVRDA